MRIIGGTNLRKARFGGFNGRLQRVVISRSSCSKRGTGDELEWGDGHEGAGPMMGLVVVWRREFKEFGDWEAKGEKAERGGERGESRKRRQKGRKTKERGNGRRE